MSEMCALAFTEAVALSVLGTVSVLMLEVLRIPGIPRNASVASMDYIAANSSAWASVSI